VRSVNTVCDGARVRCVFSRNRRKLASAAIEKFFRCRPSRNSRNRKRLRVYNKRRRKFPFATCSEECASCSLGEHQCCDPARCECTHLRFCDIDPIWSRDGRIDDHQSVENCSTNVKQKKHRTLAHVPRNNAQMRLDFDVVRKPIRPKGRTVRPQLLRVEVYLTGKIPTR